MIEALYKLVRDRPSKKFLIFAHYEISLLHCFLQERGIFALTHTLKWLHGDKANKGFSPFGRLVACVIQPHERNQWE
jgi:hypothetical protein